MRRAGPAILWLGLGLASVWAVAALAYDLSAVLAALYALALLAVLILAPRGWRRQALVLGGFLAVLAWWFTLQPTNTRPWQKDVAEMPSIDVTAQEAILHNFRNFDYRTETDFTPRWETRTVRLDDIRGIDLFLNYWGSPWIAHPLLSFDVGDGRHVVFSIETRKVEGQSYSALRGFFRQYELIYVVADERDVVRVRTNTRREDVYLYHTRATPERARAMFLAYARGANQLRAQPRWYNVLTASCTTGVRDSLVATSEGSPNPWDWRFLVNGRGDQMEYERGELAGNLPFPELKRQALINEAAKAADQAPDFSAKIRAGRAGF